MANTTHEHEYCILFMVNNPITNPYNALQHGDSRIFMGDRKMFMLCSIISMVNRKIPKVNNAILQRNIAISYNNCGNRMKNGIMLMKQCDLFKVAQKKLGYVNGATFSRLLR